MCIISPPVCFKCFIERRCQLVRLYSVGDGRTSMKHWWLDTESWESKYSLPTTNPTQTSLELNVTCMLVIPSPSIHLWSYSSFRALAFLTRRLHSSLFAALLLHPLVPSSCSTSLWTTSAHLVLGLPTGLAVWKFPFRTFFWNPFFFHPYYMTRPF
jgi:hypothetical protein